MLNIPEWEERFKRLPRSTLLQSYAYARAICPLNRQTARWGIISFNGQEAGMVQIFEAEAFKKAFHAILIDRGPLWFEGYGTDAQLEAFIKAINHEFPRRWGRRRRFIPEIQDNTNIREFMARQGWKCVNAQGYQTLWLEIDRDTKELFEKLKPAWRNMVRKAQKSGVRTEWDDTALHLEWMLGGYVADRAQKGYDGPSVKMLRALAKTMTPQKNMVIGRALIDNQPCAGVLFFLHGASATYQIGWSDGKGREAAAHNLLLWDALEMLKGRGIRNLDLGGVNDESAAGVKNFKAGMGGELVQLAGLYT
jgi:lipid II:glycine glycyltransferase (peptidoglycan interpeptide bridge formation enzyme)